MKNLYIVNGCRTAIGTFGGSLKDIPATELGAIVVKEALKRSGVKPEQVDELMFGCVLTTGLGQNVARQVAIQAGIPYSVPAYTVGMLCGSSMKSVIGGARAIVAGDANIIVCGGTENMSAAPFVTSDTRWGARMGDQNLTDTLLKDGLFDAYHDYHMGTTAENINDIWGISRVEQDAFAAASQRKAEAAQKAGKFEHEIVSVPINSKKAVVEFRKDEHPKSDVTMEKISGLQGCFPVGPGSPDPQVIHTFEVTRTQKTDDKGVQRVTAANASGINDGAAAVILASEEAVEKYHLKPMAKLIGWGQSGVDPQIMGIGPVPASRAAMNMAGVSLDEIDLIEANEAFAAQSIAVGRELEVDPSKLNVNGGAIALGHPIGASGVRIIVTLLYEMIKRPEVRLGLATLCIGGGMGTAVIVEKC
jgi:acetyl-CoA C-acetyltransferase